MHMSPSREPNPHRSEPPTDNPHQRHRKEEDPLLHIEKIQQEQGLSNYAQQDLSVVTRRPRN
jgi:hypothetical protein